MIKEYFKTYGVLTCLALMGYTSTAQVTPVDNTAENNQPIICEMPVTDEVNRIYIAPSDRVREKIENRIAPCSTFNVTYNNFPTDIFGGPGEAQLAFQYAVELWENLLDSDVPITVTANWTNLGATTLGSAGAAFQAGVPGGGANVLYAAPLAEKLLGAEIGGPNSVDIVCNFNSQFPNWYFGTDGQTPSTDFDFVTIVLHELGHGLNIAGFGRSRDNNGTEVGVIRRTSTGNFPANINDGTHANIWDTFAQNQDIFTNNVPILDETNYPDPSTTLLGGMTNDLLTIDSPTANFQNNNVLVKLYAPSTFNGGSSYSHFDESTFNSTETALMTPFAARGEAIHDPGDVTLGFMQDMGWTICDRVILSANDFATENVKISPNPFTDTLDIELPSNISNQEFNVTIVDINGKIVLDTDKTANSGKIVLNNLGNLKNALYFLNLESTSSDIKITKKLIKK